MYNSLLIEAYQNLSKEELKQLEKFLLSPYFNESEIIVQLHQYLAVIHPDFTEDNVDRIKVYKALYPKQAYDDKKLRYFRTRLLQLVERFLSINDVNDETLKKAELLKTIRRKGMDRLFLKRSKAFESQLKESELRESNHYFANYQLHDELNQYYSRSASAQNRSITSNLQETVNYLDTYYLINKLKYFCTTINYENILSYQHNNRLFEEILAHVEQENYDDVPAIEIYYQILMTLKDSDNEAHFQQLKKLLDRHYHRFSPGEAREMYIFAQNYCIKKINAGNARYLEELFALFQKGLEREIIFDHGKLSPWAYKNITVLGLRLRKTNWVKNFIEQHKTRLKRSEQKNAYTYNLAKYHFYQEDYSKVIQLLMQVEYNDVFYGLDSKAMLLKTYYELDEIEALYSICDSFRIFLKRKSIISDHHRVTYLNLIKFSKKLSRVIPGDTKKIDHIENEIKKTKQIADMNWLHEKIKELRT